MTASQGIAQSLYAKRNRELVGLINELRSFGAQAVVDLPRIAVIGNQSVGKSSLIEAISGASSSPSAPRRILGLVSDHLRTQIKVPRDSGTCTRCPMEVRLQTANRPWSCRVSLRFEYDVNGRPVDSVSEVAFGTPLTDPDKVEDRLQRAQLAILNPSVKDVSRFVSLDLTKLQDGVAPLGSTSQLDFSRNVVCVDISGPDVTNLAFVDLPGIVSNMDKTIIELVRSLVMHYIRGNCLILTALTIGDDLENQSAGLLAREEDPEGKRTIGVLTKADRLPPGEEDRWIKVLRNQSHHLRHGYFCTKLSSNAERQSNPTFAEARRAETTFFNSGIWADLEPAVRNRLGTAQLTEALSNRLVQYITETLPKLLNDLRNDYDSIVQSIRDLPEPPHEDASLELLQLCTNFAASTERYTKGSAGHEFLVQGAVEAYLQFKNDIQATVPRFVPFEKSSAKHGVNYSEPAFLKDDIEKSLHEVKEEDPLQLDLDDTRALIKQAVTRELPFNVPFTAKQEIISLSIRTWNVLAIECLDRVRPIVNNAVQRAIEQFFGRYEGGPLRGKVASLVDELIEELYDTSRERLEWLLHLDDLPYTQNTHYFGETREKVLAHFHEVRKSFDPKRLAEDQLLAITSALAAGGLPSDPSDLGKLFPPDKYEEELIVMAETRAYFALAFKRIIDDVPRAIDSSFVRPLAKQLLPHLANGLGVHSEGGSASAKAWLAENPEVAAEREELMRRKALLEKARKVLSSFGAVA